MPPKEYPRTKAGTRVHAVAKKVTCDSEAKRRYRSNWECKTVSGTVVSARFHKEQALNGEKKRGIWFITADYEVLGAPVKRVELNIRSVKMGKTHDVGTGVVTGLGGPNGTSNREEDNNTMANRSSASHEPSHNNQPEEIPNTTDIAIHDTVWEDVELLLPIGGPTHYRRWSFTTSTGERLGPDSDVIFDRSALFHFMSMFPQKQLSLIVSETNIQLIKRNLPTTSEGEVLKLFGLTILMTRFEFGSRQSLWSRSRPFKYVPPSQLGDTGMSRDRFETLMRHIRFSHQPETRPTNLSSEQFLCTLVEDFVRNFNEHRQHSFCPSDLICVDESMSRFYGLGGFWINMGLPQYIAIDRKPENGCEIQNAACGRSGVMLNIKLVKTAETGDESIKEEHGLTHGLVVLKGLVSGN